MGCRKIPILSPDIALLDPFSSKQVANFCVFHLVLLFVIEIFALLSVAGKTQLSPNMHNMIHLQKKDNKNPTKE